MSFPFTSKRLIVEAPDLFESFGAADADDIFPFFIPFKHIDRQIPDVPDGSLVLKNFPHEEKYIY